jgi:hypothetical protein
MASRKGIREPLDSLPTHMAVTFFLNHLITCVVLIQMEQADPQHHSISEEGLAEWEQKHRPDLLTCRLLSRMSMEDLLNGAGTPHESAVAALDVFVAAIKQGLVEGDPVKYVTEQTIEATREARNHIQRCETRMIFY